MQIALLLAAKIIKKETVGTYLAKGTWELYGGSGNGRGSQLYEKNVSYSTFLPPLGSVVVSKGEHVNVEVTPDSRDTELYLYFEKVKDEL